MAHTDKADKLGRRLYEQTGKWQQKLEEKRGTDHTPNQKGPAGGYDATPVPKAQQGYTIKITFHRAENLPFSDFPTFSSDPYIVAVLKTQLLKRHKQDPDLRLRTRTIHRNTDPVWETSWVVANVPESGFYLKCRLYDEDPSDHDDRLGNAHIYVNHIGAGWKGIDHSEYELKKRMASKRAYTFRGCAALLSRSVKMGGRLIVSVENLGRTQSEDGSGRVYTIAPLAWSQHYSPLIGRLVGTKDTEQGKDGKAIQKYNFQSIQMQLRGPVPADLYHRYVEFKPFVAGMFNSHTLRGRLLNRALHHQHARIYNYDRSTKYGVFEEPSVEMTKKFLEFVHYDQGGRIFTYVITLDAQLRFTETGKEFGIDLLSKHTMHSNVSIYIAYSGEFFIRRLKHRQKADHDNGDGEGEGPDPATATLPPAPEPEDEDDEQEQQHDAGPEQKHRECRKTGIFHGRPRSHHSATSSSGRHSRSPNGSPHPAGSSKSPSPSSPPTDPSLYELIIDNDSGTYRPNAEKLSELREFLTASFPGLKIATLDCQADEEVMTKLKKEQRERKKRTGNRITYMQNASMSSLSSSDEEELEARATGRPGHESRLKREYHKYMSGGVDDDFHYAGADADGAGEREEGEIKGSSSSSSAPGPQADKIHSDVDANGRLQVPRPQPRAHAEAEGSEKTAATAS